MSQIPAPISQIGNIRSTETLSNRNPIDKSPAGEGFSDVLKGQLSPQKPMVSGASQAVSGLKFSAHAIDRLKSRGISFDQEALKRIEDGIQRAASKGSKDSLVLIDDSALIVSVKNKTVVTAMDQNAMKENVFTNIDSTVIV